MKSLYPTSGSILIAQKDFKTFKYKKEYLVLNWLNKKDGKYFWRVQSLKDNGIIFTVFQDTLNELYDKKIIKVKDVKM